MRSGHKYKESITVGNLGAIATEQGRLGLARRLGQDGLRLSTELEDREGIGTAHSVLGELARFSGDLEEVRAQMAQALAIADEIGYDYLAANSLYTLALIEASEGHHAEAERQVTEGIGLAQRAGVPIVVARGRLVHGLTLLAAGQPAGPSTSCGTPAPRRPSASCTPCSASARRAWPRPPWRRATSTRP